MNEPGYVFSASADALTFDFVSSSADKQVTKKIVYQPFRDVEKLYNLALLDYHEGTWSDLTVTNNQDMRQILATVVQSLIAFFANHPDCTVFFTGSTSTRTRLYRIAIAQSLDEVQDRFRFWGVLPSGGTEPFHPNRPYEAFLIALEN